MTNPRPVGRVARNVATLIAAGVALLAVLYAMLAFAPTGYQEAVAPYRKAPRHADSTATDPARGSGDAVADPGVDADILQIYRRVQLASGFPGEEGTGWKRLERQILMFDHEPKDSYPQRAAFSDSRHAGWRLVASGAKLDEKQWKKAPSTEELHALYEDVEAYVLAHTGTTEPYSPWERSDQSWHELQVLTFERLLQKGEMAMAEEVLAGAIRDRRGENIRLFFEGWSTGGFAAEEMIWCLRLFPEAPEEWLERIDALLADQTLAGEDLEPKIRQGAVMLGEKLVGSEVDFSGVGGNTYHYLWNGKAEVLVRRLAMPIYRRHIERATVALLQNDPHEFEMALQRLESLAAPMNVTKNSLRNAFPIWPPHSYRPGTHPEWIRRFGTESTMRPDERDFQRDIYTARVVLAIVRFERRHGRLPETIEELRADGLLAPAEHVPDDEWQLLRGTPPTSFLAAKPDAEQMKALIKTSHEWEGPDAVAPAELLQAASEKLGRPFPPVSIGEAPLLLLRTNFLGPDDGVIDLLTDEERLAPPTPESVAAVVRRREERGGMVLGVSTTLKTSRERLPVLRPEEHDGGSP